MVLLSGQAIKQDTRRYDETLRQTLPMREKTDAIDYKYFIDPNLPPIKLSKEFIDDAIKTSPELAETKYLRYKSLGLSDYDSGLLVEDKATSDYFDEMIKSGVNPKLCANWLLVDIRTILKANIIDIKEFSVPPIEVAELINFIEEGTISNTQARDVLGYIYKDHKSPSQVIRELDIGLIHDRDVLLGYIDKVLEENQQAIQDYKNGKNRVVGLLVKQVIKLSFGKANPKITSDLIIERLKER